MDSPQAQLPLDRGLRGRREAKDADVTYNITKYPQRKQVALTVEEGNVIRPIAYFMDDEDALDFMQFVDRLAALSPDRVWHGWSIERRK